MKRKPLGYLLAAAMVVGFSSAQASLDWEWIGGDSAVNANGVYGTQGVPDTGNLPGGRSETSGQIDHTTPSNDFYLFGGLGYGVSTFGDLNDLWKFNPTTDEWTWLTGDDEADQFGVFGTQGVAASGNTPGARHNLVSWMDSSGNFWIFGGFGRGEASSGYLNDLWKFDPGVGQWAWIGGSKTPYQNAVINTVGTPDPGNQPGTTFAPTGAVAPDGTLWLFGGLGYNTSGSSGVLNDLWKFDPVTEEWTYVSGSDTPNQNGTYGTKGTPSISNVPGGRRYPSMWITSDGHIWVFGGLGRDASNTFDGRLNDLWEFNPSTSEWTWVAGSDLLDQNASYGTIEVSASSNVPGARAGAMAWTNTNDTLWLFGGQGYIGSGVSTGKLNDLWMFDPVIGEWTWVKGADTLDPAGTYGTEDTPAPANTPSGRSSSAYGLDSAGRIVLACGKEFIDVRHDVWRVDIAPPQFDAIALADSDPTDNADPTLYTNDLDVIVTFGAFSGTDADTVSMSEDSGFASATTVAYTGQTTETLTLAAGEGNRTVYERMRGLVGNGTSVNDNILVDTVAPVTAALDTNWPLGTLTQANPVFDVPYSATETGSGVQAVRLFYRKDAGAWTQYPDGSTTFTASPISFDTSTTGGSGTYDFYVTGLDNAGNQETKTPAADTTVDFTDNTSVRDWQDLE